MIFREQLLYGVFHTVIELQPVERCSTVRFSKKPRELFELFRRQAAREVRRVPRNHLAKDADGVEFRVTLTSRSALFLHDLKIRILNSVRVERYSLIGEQVADNAIDVVVSFIRVDIRQRSVDVKNESSDDH